MRLSLDTLIYDDKSREWVKLEIHQDRKFIAYDFPKNLLLLKKETKQNFEKTFKDNLLIFCALPVLFLSILSFALSPSVDDVSNTRMEFLYADHQSYILRPLYSIFSTTYIYDSEYKTPTLLFFNLFVASVILIGIPFIFIKIYSFYKLQKDDSEFYKTQILQWLERNHKTIIEESLTIDYTGTSFQFSEIIDNKVQKNIAYVAFETNGNLIVTTTK